MREKNSLVLASILIIGGDSKIGTALYKRLIYKNSIVWKTTRKKNIKKNEFYFNLEDEILDTTFPKIKFDFVLNQISYMIIIHAVNIFRVILLFLH